MSTKFLDNSGLSYFWGKIADRFYTKQDKLVAGTNLQVTPINTLIPDDEYIGLEYIESNGNQYIDTGLRATNKIKVEIKYQYYTNSNLSGSGRIFGNISNNSYFSIGSLSDDLSNNNINIIKFQYGDGNSVSFNYSTSTWYDIICDIPNRVLLVNNNEYELSGITGSNFLTESLKLFYFDTEIRPSSLGIGRLAYCSVWYDSVLTRVYIPVKRISDSKIGLYEPYTDTFIISSGSEDFIAGPEIQTGEALITFTNESGFITQQDISGKADKVSGATSGNFAGLDSNGNLTDSGSKASDFINMPNTTVGFVPQKSQSGILWRENSYSYLTQKPQINNETIAGNKDSTSYSLPIVTFTNIKTSTLLDNDKEVGFFDTSEDTAIWNDDRGYHVLYSLDGVAGISIVANNSRSSYYCFLESDDLIHTEIRSSDIIEIILTGTIHISVPMGANFLYILIRDGLNQNYTPELLTFYRLKDSVINLGTSGDYLTWTKNGISNNLTVPFATKASTLGTSNVGDSSTPIYLSSGVPTAITNISVTNGTLSGTLSANGDVYVNGVGGYDGTNPDPSRSLATTISNTANVQSDWNSTTGLSKISNIPSVKYIEIDVPKNNNAGWRKLCDIQTEGNYILTIGGVYANNPSTFAGIALSVNYLNISMKLLWCDKFLSTSMIRKFRLVRYNPSASTSAEKYLCSVEYYYKSTSTTYDQKTRFSFFGTGQGIKNVATDSDFSTILPETPDSPAVIESILNLRESVITEQASYYGTCTDSAETVAKTVTLSSSNFILETGVRISVKFSYYNSASSPTLNVNGTGAKAIKRYSTTNAGGYSYSSWNGGSVVDLVYDGTYWQMVGFNNTTYSTITQTEITDGTSTGNRVITPKLLHDNYEEKINKVTSLSSSSTDTQYPSAKCVYDMIGDIETLLSSI